MQSRLSRRFVLLGTSATLLGTQNSVGKTKASARESLSFEGLQAPIEIIEDNWGVCHVRAQSVADAFFANGYLVARDRLWELDFNHRQSLGRLSEVFGEDCIEFDIANRLVLFRGDLKHELALYSDVVQDAARSYVAGINSRIDEVSKNPDLLAPEFKILDYKPITWDVLDLIQIRAELTGNTKAEIRRTQLAARGALSYDALVAPLEPFHELRVPAGLDVDAVSDADLGLFGTLQKPLPMGVRKSANDFEHRKHNSGSNAWTVSGSRTASGRPILANDPHLSFSVPGPRHVIHLTAPGLDVIGGGSAGMPGVMQGHNEHFAFGRTNFHIDQEDLFILGTAPSDPELYFHNGTWKPFDRIETEIFVRNAPSTKAILRYAAQGPVVSRDPSRNRAVSVAATWLAPGANGLLANIGINLAHDWASFREALRTHTSPTNFTYADVSGNIGWQAAGGLPLRADGHDGLMPVPGDGRFDWKGMQPLEALPSSFNPARGWFSTSNEMNLPPDYPAEERRVSFEWRDRFRHQRIEQVLDATPNFTVKDCVALQHDTFSLLAMEMVRLLPDTHTGHLATETAMLRAWNGHVDATSAAAALYEVWWTHLTRRLNALLIPPSLRELLPGPVSATTQLSLFQNPGHLFGDDPIAGRSRLLMDSLQAASEELCARLGPLPAAWGWGELHTIDIAHQLTAFPGVHSEFPSVGRHSPSGGDPYTVMARWYNPDSGKPNPYAVTGGASYLMVCDVGAWDNSLYLNFPGQVGDPRSRHFSDMVAPWQSGTMQPLLFSARQIQQAASSILVLHPKGT